MDERAPNLNAQINPKRRSLALRDLVIIAFFSISTFVFSIYHHVHEKTDKWVRGRNVAPLHIDEAYIVFIVLAIGFGIYSFRRWRELGREVAGHAHAERELQKSEERYRNVLELAPDGIVNIDRAGRFTFVNSYISRRLGYVKDDMLGRHIREFLAPEYIATGEEVFAKVSQGLPIRGVEVALKNGTGGHVLFELSAIPNMAGNDFQGGVAILRDLSETRRMEKALQKANRTLRMVGDCSQKMVRATGEIAFLNDICHVIADIGGYRAAWIGLIEPQLEAAVRPVAQRGFDEGYPGTADRGRDGQGPSAGFAETAVQSGRTGIVRNMPGDAAHALWRDEAERMGYASAIAIPLISKGWSIGVLAVYARETDAFDREEIDLLTELADDVVYGIAALRTRIERERTEEALRISEAKYRTLIEQIPVVTYIAAPDATRTLAYISPQIEALLGYSEAKWRVDLQLWQKQLHPDDRERVLREVAHSRSSGEVFDSEYRMIARDGHIVWFHDTAIALRDRSDAPVVIQGVMFDITEHRRADEEVKNYRDRLEDLVEQRTAEIKAINVKLERDIAERSQAEEERRRSEEQYRNVVDNIGIGVALIGPAMEILSLNRQMKEWFPAVDVARKPICYRAFNNPPREGVCSYCPTCLTLKDGQVHQATTDTPTGDKVVHYRVISTPLKDKDGKITAAIEMVEDITERKHTEDMLRESEKRYRSVIESVAEGVVLQAAEGAIRAFNANALRILGLSSEQLMRWPAQKMPWEPIREDGTVFSQEELPSYVTLRTGKPQPGIVMGLRKPDGKVTWLLADTQPLFHTDKTAPYAVVISFFDITEQRSTEQEGKRKKTR